jgi:hypothetical protein
MPKFSMTSSVTVAALALALAAAAPAYGQAPEGGRLVIPVGSPLLDDLRFVYLDSGLAPLALSAPMTGAEAAFLLAGIDREALSDSGKAAFDRIAAFLDPGPRSGESGAEARADAPIPGLWLAFGVGTSLELFWRSDEAIPSATPWADRKALAELPIEARIGGFLLGYMALELRQDPFAISSPAASLPVPLFCNVPLDASYVDLTFPYRGFVEVGGDFWSFQLGRDALELGEGITGNLGISSNPAYYDFGRLTLFGDGVRYQVYVIQLGAERYLYGHRLDVRFAPWLTWSLQEGALDGYHGLQLRFLDPFMLFHNFFSWMDEPVPGLTVSSLALMEFVASPFRGVEAYLQGVMTQYQTPYEIEHWPDDAGKIPNGLGFLGGARWYLGAGEGIVLLWAEGAYTWPYLYLHDNDETRQIASNFVPSIYSGGDPWWKRWIGYRFGPDSAVAAFGCEYRGADADASLQCLFLADGEVEATTPYPTTYEQAQVTGPSGVPEYLLRIDAEFAWRPWDGVEFGANAGFAMLWNAGHATGATRTGVELGFFASWTAR